MDLTISLDPQASAPRRARAALDGLAGVLPAAKLDDVRLVVSELVTNSVKYGPGRPVELKLSVGPDGVVRGEVVDQGDGVVEIRKAADDAEPTPGGYGLLLVDRLSRRWGVHAGSTHVWFEIDR